MRTTDKLNPLIEAAKETKLLNEPIQIDVETIPAREKLAQFKLTDAQRLAFMTEERDEMREALRDLFANCAIIHSKWGDDSNAKEANAAIAHARRLAK